MSSLSFRKIVATAIPIARSTMLATTATGGVLRLVMPVMLTTATLTIIMLMSVGMRIVERTRFLCVASRTARENLLW
ncbi:MAG: hypothetical protein LBC87_07195 [Fibromonadaceae bacterium]|jgi:hypothetical protein|nr:hypothetical protein [Fibromonadaceae bacterium]